MGNPSLTLTGGVGIFIGGEVAAITQLRQLRNYGDSALITAMSLLLNVLSPRRGLRLAWPRRKQRQQA